MTQARILLFAAVAGILAFVLVVLRFTLSPADTPILPLLVIHGLMFVLGLFALARMVKMPHSSTDLRAAFWPPALGLLVLSALLALSVVLAVGKLDLGLGLQPDGTTVNQKRWHESEGKYWLSINGQPAVEISAAEYDKAMRSILMVFALILAAFSYIALLLSYYAWHRVCHAPVPPPLPERWRSG